MKTKALLPIGLLLAFVGGLMIHHSPADGVNTVQLPEFVVTDQNDVILGPISGASTLGQMFVLMHNSVHDESFYLQVSENHFGGADTGDVFFSTASCTGTAYVYSTDIFAGVASIRGSVYGVGPDDAGGTTCCKIYRGGPGAGANNDLAIQSRYRSSAANGPECTSADAGVNTVVATEVLDLSHIDFPLQLLQ